ncbi:hypothetical protein Enr13x_60540 [Stieleria neptunia]|uniref:Uncharacterized protein n=1 Tax=Stieleria neptunia TaxID=2527979 RepID=A0A518HZ77_9BACT|nr:hypothetical protein Enr13x_60540 [Stieleria neptunia]
MSSSNRTAIPCEAAVYRNDHPVGPMRLPMKDPAAFIKEFNRLYREAGIVIEPIEHSAANCSPGKKC